MVILVVDDDPVSRMVAEHILRGGGHEVVSAEDAAQARSHCAALGDDIALIVCDYNMPGESGLDLLDQALEHRATPTPFVLITGVGEADELDDDRADKVTAYLTKPVQSTELLEVVDGLVAANT